MGKKKERNDTAQIIAYLLVSTAIFCMFGVWSGTSFFTMSDAAASHLMGFGISCASLGTVGKFANLAGESFRDKAGRGRQESVTDEDRQGQDKDAS